MKQETTWKRKRSQVSVLQIVAIALSVLFQGNMTKASEVVNEKSTSEEKSIWKTVRSRVRLRTFTEFMTPAIHNNQNYIPFEDGSKLLPTNTFNVVWIDYEIAKDTKVVYYQRSNMNYADTTRAQGVHTIPRNPRFALRRVNLFSAPNLNTTYDIYVQPGLAPESELAGRNLEFGFRTNTSYVVPHSKFSVGAITEFTTAICFNKPGPQGSSNVYGWAMPWVSYDLSKTFSTLHFLAISFQHLRETQGIVSDYPMPFNTQNGVGINLSQDIWAAVLLNNYLNTAPTLANTWASVWLTLNVL